jgi:hypothetical protein
VRFRNLVRERSRRTIPVGEVYRYDPAWLLLVWIDLPVATQVLEASPRAPDLAVRTECEPWRKTVIQFGLGGHE